MKLVKFIKFLFIYFIFIFKNLSSQTIENLDTSFGQGAGYVTTQNAQGFVINKIKLQSDGKIIAVGSTQNPNTQAIIARYKTDGTIDTVFGTSGIVTATIGSSLSTTVITDVAIQSSDGKIVIAGYTYDTNLITLFFVARYTSAGVLDTTFNSPNGFFTANFGTNSIVNGVTIDSSGNIIVVGTVVNSGVSNALIARYTSSGALDTTFGSSGSVIALVGIKTILNAISLDSSGNLIVAGYYATSGSSGEQFIMARYTSAGVLDTTFNSPIGFVTGSIAGSSQTIISSIALDSSGNIVVSGFAQVGSADQFLVARYTSSGSLDTTFNSPNGFITSLVGSSSRSNSIAIQSDGKILIAGYIDFAIAQATIARYNSNGTSDTTFGSGGTISLNIGNNSNINSIVIQSTDSRVVAGGYEIDPTTHQPFGLVIRFNKNNTDFVNTTSITNGSTITTKFPTISGLSSGTTSPQATVQPVINGVNFGSAVNTLTNGNWTAGTSSALPVGSNTIQANLIISSATVVSEEIKFTVTDNLGDDSLLAYSTATQTLTAANTAKNVTFNNAPLTTTWTNNGSDTFTCHQTGKYLITYNILGNNTTAIGSPITTNTISVIILQNSTEIGGSQTGAILFASEFKLISNSIIANISSGDTIKCQFAGSATTVQLAPTGIGTSTLQSAKLNITRLS